MFVNVLRNKLFLKHDEHTIGTSSSLNWLHASGIHLTNYVHDEYTKFDRVEWIMEMRWRWNVDKMSEKLEFPQDNNVSTESSN